MFVVYTYIEVVFGSDLLAIGGVYFVMVACRRGSCSASNGGVPQRHPTATMVRADNFIAPPPRRPPPLFCPRRSPTGPSKTGARCASIAPGQSTDDNHRRSTRRSGGEHGSPFWISPNTAQNSSVGIREAIYQTNEENTASSVQRMQLPRALCRCRCGGMTVLVDFWSLERQHIWNVCVSSLLSATTSSPTGSSSSSSSGGSTDTSTTTTTNKSANTYNDNTTDTTSTNTITRHIGQQQPQPEPHQNRHSLFEGYR